MENLYQLFHINLTREPILYSQQLGVI